MLSSKERAEYRARSNTLDTTLIVGKGGITETVVADADQQLTARELVKGRVLEASLLSAREASDALCEALGADGVTCVGSKFVLYRFSEKCQAERNAAGRAKRKAVPISRADPVRKGVKARRMAAKKAREERNSFFREIAREQQIEKHRADKDRG